MNKIKEVLHEEGGNYILPFLWHHGESQEIIREEIEKIYDCGIRALCVESRPHPDFCGEGWWQDMGFILELAKEKGMRVWLLDDAHFPTGFANGLVETKYPHLRKKVLTWRVVQGVGPMCSATFMLGENLPFWGVNAQTKIDDPQKIVAVIAARKNTQTCLYDEAIDLTEKVTAGRLVWDIPEGIWHLYTIYETSAKHAPNYMSLIERDSVKVLLEAVYEAHYTHFKAYFGTTFAGFFSDEAGFGNGVGISNSEGFMFKEGLGREKMDLIWSEDVKTELIGRWGEDWRTRLLGLWQPVDRDQELSRYDYMDIVSRLLQKNFSRQIGDWCRERNVEYIGHIIEDNGAHARLGCGVGHYFRALSGQDMAGIDSIGDQTTPGLSMTVDDLSMAHRNGRFYHYALGKLGSSLAHIQPMKQGRTMCEIFGAGGWREGTKLMKWNLDHMLVRGINYFVPHAFSAKDFPDMDCPPHFYARGNNPQYRFFAKLMTYTNRMCHLLNGGLHVAPVALLYPAEGEWMGGCMPVEEAAIHLCQNQLDFDILPMDVFLNEGEYPYEIRDGKLKVNLETYDCIVIPFSDYVTQDFADGIARLTEQGVPVFQLQSLPTIAENMKNTVNSSNSEKNENADFPGVEVVQPEALAATLRSRGIGDIELSGVEPLLSYYHYVQDGMDIYMFFNEEPYRTIETRVSIGSLCTPLLYDAMDNKLCTIDHERRADGIEISLALSPYESRVLILPQKEAAEALMAERMETDCPSNLTEALKAAATMDENWQIAFSTAQSYPSMSEERAIEALVDISSLPGCEAFSGTIRYTRTLEAEAQQTVILDFGRVYEAAQLWVNGVDQGSRLHPPYRWDRVKLQPGHNRIELEATNTLVRQVPDFGSLGHALEPVGLLGPVKLHIIE